MEESNKKTLVFGASTKEERYSNKAVALLRQYNHDVIAVGIRAGEIHGVSIQSGEPKIEALDTLTIYLSEERQKNLEDYFLSLNPKRIIFNPGAENPSLYKKAQEAEIEVVNACTLVMLRTDQY